MGIYGKWGFLAKEEKSALLLNKLQEEAEFQKIKRGENVTTIQTIEDKNMKDLNFKIFKIQKENDVSIKELTNLLIEIEKDIEQKKNVLKSLNPDLFVFVALNEKEKLEKAMAESETEYEINRTEIESEFNEQLKKYELDKLMSSEERSNIRIEKRKERLKKRETDKKEEEQALNDFNLQQQQQQQQQN